MSEPIKSFTSLNAWKESHQLALMAYKLTKDFPKEELFGLTNQIRRAAVSVPSNIAEGFHRYSFKEKVQFYHIANGSIAELHAQLLIAKDIGYLQADNFHIAHAQLEKSHKIINGLLRKTKETSKS